MRFIGDVHIYVSDFDRALRFWADGLQLEVVERETSRHSAFARLDFPEGGSSLRLIGPAEAWDLALRPPHGTQAGISFDVTTADFDDTLIRLIEHGGTQVDEIESYQGLRAVTVADPDGNTFELLEIREEPDAVQS